MSTSFKRPAAFPSMRTAATRNAHSGASVCTLTNVFGAHRSAQANTGHSALTNALGTHRSAQANTGYSAPGAYTSKPCVQHMQLTSVKHADSCVREHAETTETTSAAMRVVQQANRTAEPERGMRHAYTHAAPVAARLRTTWTWPAAPNVPRIVRANVRQGSDALDKALASATSKEGLSGPLAARRAAFFTRLRAQRTAKVAAQRIIAQSSKLGVSIAKAAYVPYAQFSASDRDAVTHANDAAQKGQQTHMLAPPVAMPQDYVPRVRGISNDPRELSRRAIEACRMQPAITMIVIVGENHGVNPKRHEEVGTAPATH